MARFAKLIELKNNEQLLLVIDFNDSEDIYEISVSTDLDGCRAKLKIGVESLEFAESMLNDYTQEQGELFRAEMLNLFKP